LIGFFMTSSTEGFTRFCRIRASCAFAHNVNSPGFSYFGTYYIINKYFVLGREYAMRF
jgi:hypothetical protein